MRLLFQAPRTVHTHTHTHTNNTYVTQSISFVNQSNQLVNQSVGSTDGRGVPLFPLLLEVVPCHPILFAPEL